MKPLPLLLISALAASAQPQQDPHTPEPGQEWRGNSPAVKGGEAVWIVSTNDGAVQYRESDGFLDRDNLWSIGEFRWQWHWINSPSNAVIENITIFGWTNSGSQVRESTHIPEGWWARIGSDGILNLNPEMTNWLKLRTNLYAICDGKLEPVIQIGTCRFIGCRFVRDTNFPDTGIHVSGDPASAPIESAPHTESYYAPEPITTNWQSFELFNDWHTISEQATADETWRGTGKIITNVLHQVADQSSNTWAYVLFKGRTKRMLLESVKLLSLPERYVTNRIKYVHVLGWENGTGNSFEEDLPSTNAIGTNLARLQ